jgi:hypothetical protein
MSCDLHTLERLVEFKLEEARRHAAVARLAARAAGPGLLVLARRRLGLALVRTGRRLAGRPTPHPRPA